MDQQSFDRLARLLGGATDRRAGLKAALGAVLGGGVAAAAAALDRDAQAKRKGKGDRPEAGKKKRQRCKPACAGGYVCEKVGRKRACVCPSGVTCGAACCAAGQACEGGACVDSPEPVECIAAGEPCKNRGRRCCDGRVCASGQGGLGDVACYSPKTGACTTRTDCVYGMACVNGRCAPPAPAGLAQACDAGAQQLCTTPGATCTAYSASGAPGGSYCTLPVGMTCTGDPECTCYRCFYANGSVQGGSRAGRISANAKSCCFPSGQGCQNDNQCCTGLSCVNGTCGGTICAPAGGDCSGGVACCNGGTCTGNVCPGGGGRTCTVNYTTGDPGKSFDDLKAALIAAQGDLTNPAKNPVYVGTGTYVFTSTVSLDHDNATVPLEIRACGDGPVWFDGGADVKKGGSAPSETDNAKDLTWANGVRILQLGRYETENSAGYVIDGIDFRNGVDTSGFSGAIYAESKLVLSNSKVMRCKGETGGVRTLMPSEFTNLTITQCNGNGSTQTAGGLYIQGSNTLENVTVIYNAYTGSTPSNSAGGVYAAQNPGKTTIVKGTSRIESNDPNGVFVRGGTVSCASGVTICGNPSSGATGLTNCGGAGAFSGCPATCDKNAGTTGTCPAG